MPLNIVIVSWNVEKLLLQCLQHLVEAGADMRRVAVIDNASADNSVQGVRTRFPEVKLIANTRNVGFAKAVNQGITQLPPGHVLLLNPDCLVKKDTLTSSLEILESIPNIGVLGCRLVNEDGTTQESIRALPGIRDQLLILLKLHRFFGNSAALQRYYASDCNYNQSAAVEQVKGAYFLIHQRAMEKIGILDERFFIWFEEVDYCKRVRDVDMLVYYTSSTEAMHARGESFRQVVSVKKQWYFTQSMLKYFRKHGTWLDVLGISLAAPIGLFISLALLPVSLLKVKTPTAHD